MTEIVIDVNVLIGIGAIILPITAIFARHLWIKGKCFGLMKAAIEQLQNHDEGSSDTHGDLYEKVNKIERNLYHMMGQMKIKPVD